MSLVTLRSRKARVGTPTVGTYPTPDPRLPASPAPAYAQESAMEVLYVFACSGDYELQRLMAAQPSMLARLVPLLSGGFRVRAAGIMCSLAIVPGNRHDFRPYEAGIAHIALHPPAAAEAAGEILSLLAANI